MTTTSTRNMNAALAYARLGCSILPLKPSAKEPDTAKAPHGKDDATSDAGTIGAWFSASPDLNIGVACEPSGIVALDIDPRYGGGDTLHDLEREHGALPDTVRVLTGRGDGGLHVWFKRPADVVLGDPHVGPGVQVKSVGYLVAPRSIHPDTGRTYEFELGHELGKIELADLPEWLVTLWQSRIAAKPHIASDYASTQEEMIVAGGRNTELTSLGGSMRRRGFEHDAILAALTAQNRARCLPPLEDDEVGRIARSVSRYPPTAREWAAQHRNGHGEQPAAERTPQGFIAEMSAAPDLDNAERLVARHGERLRYCGALGGFMIWTGTRWRLDTLGQVHEWAKETIDSAISEALKDGKDKLARALINARQGKRLAAMVQLAATDSRIAVEAAAFDRNPWLLNCPNGTVDLRTGKLREHRPEDLITKVTAVDYDPDAISDRWSRFLVEATGVDTEYIEYLQRLFGHAVCGDRSPELVGFVHGPPGTGKTTFVEAIKAALGDYSATADFSTWIVSKDRPHGGTPREDLTRLKGARLVISVEVAEGSRLAEGLVSLVSGGDDVTARAPHARHSVSYKPEFFLCMVANHAPKVSHDSAVWRRLRRLPFEHVPAQRDDSLKADLRSNPEHQRAVLAWLVQGCLAWQREGMGTAQVVENATRQYRDTADVIGEWITEHITFTGDDEHRLTRAQIRTHFETWIKENRYLKPRLGDLYARLEAMGATDTKSHGERGFGGIVWQE